MLRHELLDEPYAVSAEDHARFQRDGHILCRGVLPDVAAVRPILRDVAYGASTERRPLHERDTFGKAFLQMVNLWRRDERVARFVFARRFAGIAARLMGVPAVRLYHDQALFKEPGGGATPWHQDQIYWPLDTPNTITMWMPLVDITDDVGSMTFATGSHRLHDAAPLVISDASEAQLADVVAAHGFTPATYGAMRAGDATFHAGWTIHRAGPNPSAQVREVMTIIYFADGTRVGGAETASRQADAAAFLPGLRDGDLAAGELTPLLTRA